MPLNEKGKKIMTSMKKQYGKKKGEEVFYAMENSGKLKKVTKARTGYAASGQYDKGDKGRDPSQQYATSKPKGERVSPSGKQALTKQRTQTIKAISPSTTVGGQALKYGLMFSGVPFPSKLTSGILDRGQNLGYGRTKKTKTKKVGGNGDGSNNIFQKKILPIQATKPIDTSLVSPKDNFFKFKAYKVGGLSGGVSYGPPPKKGPNSQVPPVKLKKGGF